MTTRSELEDRWQRYAASIRKANLLNKALVFDALSAACITHIVIGFDGEGDSGQIDGGAAFIDDQSVDFPTGNISIFRAQSGNDEFATDEVNIRSGIEELCYGFLEQEHGGWENNDGAFGEFVFDVAAQTISLEFHARFTDTVYSTHSF